MIAQSKGKMYLTAERGHTETDWFRSFNTFQFGNYQHADKTPFGPIYVLNNDMLGGGKSVTLTIEEATNFTLIPTVGAVIYTDSLGGKEQVEVGQCFWKSLPAGTNVLLQNPYEEELINYVQVWIKVEEAIEVAHIASFNIGENKNQLIRISPDISDDTGNFSIGKFDGRKETSIQLADNKGLFVYVIEGAFEVQYRLLETGDGLALWDTEAVEMEALSNGAIILAVKIPFSESHSPEL